LFQLILSGWQGKNKRKLAVTARCFQLIRELLAAAGLKKLVNCDIIGANE